MGCLSQQWSLRILTLRPTKSHNLKTKLNRFPIVAKENPGWKSNMKSQEGLPGACSARDVISAWLLMTGSVLGNGVMAVFV